MLIQGAKHRTQAIEMLKGWQFILKNKLVYKPCYKLSPAVLLKTVIVGGLKRRTYLPTSYSEIQNGMEVGGTKN
jgi:hypothetical protein